MHNLTSNLKKRKSFITVTRKSHYGANHSMLEPYNSKKISD